MKYKRLSDEQMQVVGKWKERLGKRLHRAGLKLTKSQRKGVNTVATNLLRIMFFEKKG